MLFCDYSRSRVSAAADRKSTRLNSSHSQISYAVFCLKKKTSLLIIFSHLNYHAVEHPLHVRQRHTVREDYSVAWGSYIRGRAYDERLRCSVLMCLLLH